MGFVQTVNGFGMIVNTLRMLFSGQASPKELGGPIMIAQLAGQFAERGWTDLFYFMALISVNLAFINLLPIPGLDGGHIFITLIEGTIRRPLSVKTRMLIQQVGMVFLLLIMATVLQQIINKIPKRKQISNQSYEGANIILYTKSKDFFKNGTPTIRELVNEFKKRIELRLDPDLLTTEKKAEEERKIKAEVTRKLQEEEVKKSGEIERENLKKMEEKRLNNFPKQEKIE